MGLITKSSPINFGGMKNMLPQMMYMMRQKHMLDLRNTNMQELLKKRMSGYEGLETQRHESRMTEIGEKHEKDIAYLHEKVMAELADDSTIDRQAGKIHLKEMKGEDVTADKERLAKIAGTMGSMIAKEANLETIDAKEATELAMVASEDFLRQYGTQMATTGRQEKRLKREVEPSLAIAERGMDVKETQEERLGGESETGSFDDLAELYSAVSSEEKSLLSKIDKAFMDKELSDQLKSELSTLRDEKSMVYNKMKQAVLGAPGGASTSAFRRYYDILISKGATPEEAEAIARKRFPE